MLIALVLSYKKKITKHFWKPTEKPNFNKTRDMEQK